MKYTQEYLTQIFERYRKAYAAANGKKLVDNLTYSDGWVKMGKGRAYRYRMNDFIKMCENLEARAESKQNQ